MGRFVLVYQQSTIHQTYVDYHPVRAMTRLTVSHRGKSPFTLEKLKLPMRYLSLSRDVNGQFHTDGLKVTTHDDRLSLKLAKDTLMDGTKEFDAHPWRKVTNALQLGTHFELNARLERCSNVS